jgi:hypothetical protein
MLFMFAIKEEEEEEEKQHSLTKQNRATSKTTNFIY